MFSYSSDESWRCTDLQNWGYNSCKSLCIWVTKQLWQIVFSKLDICLYISLIWHAFLTLWLKSSLRLLLLKLSEVSWLAGSVERWQRWQGAPILRLVPCMHCLIKFSQKPLRQVLLLSSHFTDDNAEAYNSCPKSRSYKQQVVTQIYVVLRPQNYYASQRLHHTSQETSFILQNPVQISLDTLCLSQSKLISPQLLRIWPKKIIKDKITDACTG